MGERILAFDEEINNITLIIFEENFKLKLKFSIFFLLLNRHDGSPFFNLSSLNRFNLIQVVLEVIHFFLIILINLKSIFLKYNFHK